MSNYSYSSATGLNELLRTMFPDSDIAKKFQLSSTKIAYIIRFGLAPYFHSKLLSEVKKCDHFVLAFDESLNKVTQHGQMDIHIRFFLQMFWKGEHSIFWITVSWTCHSR